MPTKQPVIVSTHKVDLHCAYCQELITAGEEYGEYLNYNLCKKHAMEIVEDYNHPLEGKWKKSNYNPSK